MKVLNQENNVYLICKGTGFQKVNQGFNKYWRSTKEEVPPGTALPIQWINEPIHVEERLAPGEGSIQLPGTSSHSSYFIGSLGYFEFVKVYY